MYSLQADKKQNWLYPFQIRDNQTEWAFNN